MQLTATPGQLGRRAAFYFELAQLTSAGVGLIGAVQHLATHPAGRHQRESLRIVLGHLDSGLTFSEALRGVPGWLPELDLALIQGGEMSGRLDTSFRTLAGFYDERARMARQFLGDIAYPVFLFHFAVFLLPFAAFITSGDLASYARDTLGVLLPCYALIALIIYASQGTHGERWRSLWEKLLGAVPLLGRARRELTLARLAAALEALLSAGVSIVQAWILAADASGSPAAKRTVASWREHLEAGHTPSDMVSASGFFPPLFASHYATGELSGSLEEQLGRLHRYYSESGMRTMRAISAWAPRLFYLVVVLLIAYRVLRFWSGYFQNINNVLGG
jgi:type II secretory pathway component PulF